MSLRLRVALLTAAAVAIFDVAIVAEIYTATTDRLYTQAEQELRSAASVIVSDEEPSASSSSAGGVKSQGLITSNRQRSAKAA